MRLLGLSLSRPPFSGVPHDRDLRAAAIIRKRRKRKIHAEMKACLKVEEKKVDRKEPAVEASSRTALMSSLGAGEELADETYSSRANALLQAPRIPALLMCWPGLQEDGK